MLSQKIKELKNNPNTGFASICAEILLAILKFEEFVFTTSVKLHFLNVDLGTRGSNSLLLPILIMVLRGNKSDAS